MIPCPNTRAKSSCIKDSLNYAEHGVNHTTLVLEIDCLTSICILYNYHPTPSKDVGDANQDMTLCNAKVGTSKHGTLASTYKGMKKEYCSINNVEYKFWFFSDNIKRCVSGSKKKYV